MLFVYYMCTYRVMQGADVTPAQTLLSLPRFLPLLRICGINKPMGKIGRGDEGLRDPQISAPAL
jgi:hypothetical protein